MKTLNFLSVLCIICFNLTMQGQTNILSGSESFWSSLKINGIKLDNIDEIKGDKAKLENKLKNLFGNDMKKTRVDDSLDIHYFKSEKKGLYLDFENFQNTYFLYSLYITNKNSNINILGVTLTIGDSINKLGNVKIDYKDNEIRFIPDPAYTDCCIYLRIKFDPKTKKITNIDYYSGTD